MILLKNISKYINILYQVHSRTWKWTYKKGTEAKKTNRRFKI